MNVTEFQIASLGNSPSALTIKPYVLIKLRRNSYTLVTDYLKGCNNPPCNLPQLRNAVIHMSFVARKCNII